MYPHQPSGFDTLDAVYGWIDGHLGILATFIVCIGGAVWKSASLVSEIREQRKDFNDFMLEYRREALRWREYVDSSFNNVNARLDRLADKDR